MKENVIRLAMVSGLLTILIGLFTFSSFASSDILSEEMHAWGFRRGENHEQPDLDSRKFRSIKKI